MAAKAKSPSQPPHGLLACNCGHVLSLKDLYGVLRLSEEEVLSVLVTGSHLWRTCVATSDWDVYVIVKDSRKTSRDAEGVKRTKSKQFDAAVLSELEFRSLLEGNVLQYVLPLWAPDRLCVRKTDFRRCFRLDREKLRGQLAETVSRDLRVAKKHFEKGKSLQSKKVLCHCLQYLAAADQLMESGEVRDYSTCNAHRTDILSCLAMEWDALEAIVQPHTSPHIAHV